MKCGDSVRRPWRLGRGLVALTLVLMGLTQTVSPAGAQGAGIDGNTFTGEAFDWSVTWDDSLWTNVNVGDLDGGDLLTMALAEGQPVGLATIIALPEFGGDPDACVEAHPGIFLERDEISDVLRQSSVTVPGAPSGQANGAFNYTFAGESGNVRLVDYVQCRTLVPGEAVLLAYVTSTHEDFTTVAGLFRDVLNTVEIGEAQGDDTSTETDGSDEDTDESGANPGSFSGLSFAWSIAWDDAAWTMVWSNDENGDDNLGLMRLGEPALYPVFKATAAYDGDPDECIADFEPSGLPGSTITDLREATEVDLPDAPRGTANGAWAYVYTDERGTVDFIDYVVCQPLVEGESVLIAWISTTEDHFEADVESFHDLLDGVEIEGGEGTGGDEDVDVEDKPNGTDPRGGRIDGKRSIH